MDVRVTDSGDEIPSETVAIPGVPQVMKRSRHFGNRYDPLNGFLDRSVFRGDGIADAVEGSVHVLRRLV